MLVSGLIEAMQEELSWDNFLSHLPEWVLMIILLIGFHCIAGIVMVILLVKRNNERPNEFDTQIEEGIQDIKPSTDTNTTNTSKEALTRQHKEDETTSSLKATPSNDLPKPKKDIKGEQANSCPSNFVMTLDEMTGDSSASNPPTSRVNQELSLLTDDILPKTRAPTTALLNGSTRSLPLHLIATLEKPDKTTDDNSTLKLNQPEPLIDDLLPNVDVPYVHSDETDDRENLEIRPIDILPLIQPDNQPLLELQVVPEFVYLTPAIEESGEDNMPPDIVVGTLPHLPHSMEDSLVYTCNNSYNTTTSDHSSNNRELVHY